MAQAILGDLVNRLQLVAFLTWPCCCNGKAGSRLGGKGKAARMDGVQSRRGFNARIRV